jgi:hypothetical protein
LAGILVMMVTAERRLALEERLSGEHAMDANADRLAAKQLELDMLSADVQAQLKHLKDALPTDSVEARVAIEKDLKGIRDRLDRLYSILGNTPEMTIQLAQMRADIDNLKSVRTADLVAYKDGLDRTYSLLSILGGIFAVTIGAIISVALGSKKSLERSGK